MRRIGITVRALLVTALFGLGLPAGVTGMPVAVVLEVIEGLLE